MIKWHRGIGTQWLAACYSSRSKPLDAFQCHDKHLSSSGSVITQFNLDRLSGFEWSQKQAEMDQLQACAESNSSDCSVSAQAFRGLETHGSDP